MSLLFANAMAFFKALETVAIESGNLETIETADCRLGSCIMDAPFRPDAISDTFFPTPTNFVTPEASDSRPTPKVALDVVFS